MNIAISILIGVLGSVIASCIFLLAVRALRPRLEISPTISKWKGENDIKYVIKIINRGRRKIVDLRFELLLVTKKVVPGGELSTTRALDLKKDRAFILPEFEKKSDRALFARRITILDDIDALWDKDTSQYLIFRAYAHDEVSGLARLFQSEYRTKRNTLIDGEFHFGDSFEIS